MIILDDSRVALQTPIGSSSDERRTLTDLGQEWLDRWGVAGCTQQVFQKKNGGAWGWVDP